MFPKCVRPQKKSKRMYIKVEKYSFLFCLVVSRLFTGFPTTLLIRYLPITTLRNNFFQTPETSRTHRMKISTLILTAFAALVAATPAPNAAVSAAQAVGAKYNEFEKRFCCDPKDCKYYDDGCHVRTLKPLSYLHMETNRDADRWILLPFTVIFVGFSTASDTGAVSASKRLWGCYERAVCTTKMQILRVWDLRTVCK